MQGGGIICPKCKSDNTFNANKEVQVSSEIEGRLDAVMTRVPERWDIGQWDEAHWDGQLGLDAAPGAFVLAGRPIALTYADRIGLLPGSFALTGRAAALRLAYRLTAAPGAFTLTGSPVGLFATSASAAVLHVTPGVFQLVGSPASLTVALGWPTG